MKTILVPTDFTITANKAVFCAAELAYELEAKLVLLHVCRIPIVKASSGNFIFPTNVIDDHAQLWMDSLQDKLLKKYAYKIQIEACVARNLSIAGYQELVAEYNPDLIVVGVNQPGFNEDKWSEAAVKSIFRKAACPVLGVKNETSLMGAKRILMGFEGDLRLNNPTRGLIKLLTNRFDSSFSVAVVSSEKKNSGFRKVEAERYLSNVMPKMKCEVRLRQNLSFVEELTNQTNESKADFVLMLPSAQYSTADLMNKQFTERVVVEGKIPALTRYN